MRQHKLQKLLLPLSIALALSGCGEDFKDCNGFWDKTIGRDSCSTINVTEAIDRTLSPDVQKAFGADPNKNDTDGDGLSDTFEIAKGFPYLKPDNKDTDNNGIDDAKDDTDKDGLTNLEEMQSNTSPINPDTDGDGLSDKAELQTYKTNPLVADTDKDTIIDGREIANGSNPLVADADKFVTSSDIHTLFNEDGTTQKLTVAIAGKGDLASKVEVTGWSDFKTPFQVGRSYDIGLDDADKVNMQDATITLPYDPNDPAASNPNELKIYTINPTTRFYEELPTTVDTVSNTLTAKTTHFSPFLIGNAVGYSSYVQAIPQTCPLIGDPNAIPVDVTLVIDSSGSMLDNDPQDLRITAAKSFITNMKASDRAAIVDFDSGVTVRQNLTADKTALSSALNQIDSNGGTDIGAGVGSAYSILTNQSDSSRTRVVILLTDGQGSYDKALSNQLKSQNIRVFTIGLTGQVDEVLLKEISSVTNGGYKQINDASGLVGVFGQFATVFGDTGKDTDQDGLTDCQEIQGIHALNYNENYPRLDSSLIFTKHDNPDTDGDGVFDGMEIGSITESIGFNGKKFFTATIVSNPEKTDTDGDGISDADELYLDTDALNKDSDSDGLSDSDEILKYGSDPLLFNTDGDNFSDYFEANHANENDPTGFVKYNPTLYNFNDAEFKAEFLKGMIYGDLDENANFVANPSVPQLLGNIASGVLVYGDARNLVTNLAEKNFFSASLDLLGLVPLVGDSAKITTKVSEFSVKNPSKVVQLTQYAGALPEPVAKIVRPAIKLIRNPVWDVFDPFKRGKELEKIVVSKYPDIFKGEALLGNYPTIDVWDFASGKAISIKSLDLDKPTYASASEFKRKLEKYTASLKGFPPSTGSFGKSETSGMQVIIRPDQIKSKELALVIPRELSDEYKKVLDSVQSSSGIGIKVIIE